MQAPIRGLLWRRRRRRRLVFFLHHHFVNHHFVNNHFVNNHFYHLSPAYNHHNNLNLNYTPSPTHIDHNEQPARIHTEARPNIKHRREMWK